MLCYCFFYFCKSLNIESYSIARDYYNEIIPRIELFNIAGILNTLMQSYTKDISAQQGYNDKAIAKLEDIFKEYNPILDKQLFEKLMTFYVNNQSDEFVSPYLKQLLKTKDIHAIADDIYTSSIMNTLSNIKSILNNTPATTINLFKNGGSLLVC